MERSSSRAVTALLVAIISIPLSSQAIFRSQDDDGQKFEALGDIRQQVYSYQAGERQLLRRAYSRAVEDYRERLKRGDADAVKPDINDPSTFADFMTGEELASRSSRTVRTEGRVHAAPVSESQLGTDDLTSRQRSLLRNYTRAGRCPPSMEKIFPGFHQLCVGIVGDDALQTLPTGIETDLKALRTGHRSSEPTSIKLRLKMLEQARDRSTRRKDMQGPMRPTPYTGE